MCLIANGAKTFWALTFHHGARSRLHTVCAAEVSLDLGDDCSYNDAVYALLLQL